MNRLVSDAWRFVGAALAAGSCIGPLDFYPDPTVQGGGGASTASTTTTSQSGTGSTSGVGGEGGGAGPCAPVTVEAAGIETFDDSLHPGWCALENGATDDEIVVSGGAARVRTVSATWNHDEPHPHAYGPLFYRQIVGGDDFAVVARIDVSGASGAPNRPFQGGGLMVRRPNDTPGYDEDFVMLSVGSMPVSGGGGGGGGGDTAFGTSWWSAENNVVNPRFQYAFGAFDGIAICRLGTRFEVWVHEAATAWQPATPDASTTSFPIGAGRNLELSAAPVLQIGLTAHVAMSPGLTEVAAKGMRFARITNGSCAQGLVDPASLE